jgi:hypothetical protein
MTANKHIAMWTCARSRSTLVTRAFQQLDGCVIFDEPFYPPYLFTQQVDHPQRLEIIERHNVVDARGAGEMASTSGLACILVGLQRAPQIKVKFNTRVADIINLNNLLAVVVPATCLGGVPILQAQKYHVPVIAVRENHTILNVSQSKIQLDNVIEVHSYAEAAGIILALKNGIDLKSISRPLVTLM